MPTNRMATWTRNIAVRQNYDSLIAAAAGCFIILLYSKHGGIGISPDSVTYISSARSLLDGKGLTEFDNMPLVDFPALYPLFLSGVKWLTRKDPMVFGPWLNGILFGFLLYLSGAIMNGFLFRSKWYKRMVLSCLVLSPCLLEIYSMLWSETLFLLLLLGFFIAAKIYLERPAFGSLLVLALLAGLSCVTRYAGVTLIATGGLMIILNQEATLYKRMVHIGLFSICSPIPLVINLVRNAEVSGTFTGIRQKGITPLIQNLHYFGDILSDWLPVPKNNYFLPIVVTLACILFLLLAFLFLYRKRGGYHSYEIISAVFSLVYIGFMLLSATVSRYEQFSSRLLSPLFIPMIWGITGLFPGLRPGSATLRYAAIAAGCLLWVAFQQNQWLQNRETYEGVKDAGIPGYTEDPWPNSPLVRFINESKGFFRPGYGIYSNAPDFVYLYSGMHCYQLPQKVFGQEVHKFYEDPRHYILWFNDIDNSDLPTLEEIRLHQPLSLVQQFADGAIYVASDSPATSH
jgi:hypothetical protein